MIDNILEKLDGRKAILIASNYHIASNAECVYQDDLESIDFTLGDSLRSIFGDDYVAIGSLSIYSDSCISDPLSVPTFDVPEDSQAKYEITKDISWASNPQGCGNAFNYYYPTCRPVPRIAFRIITIK